MYQKFYGFKGKPFNITPDSRFFFSSSKHAEALSMLTYTISQRKGFAVLTGEIGSGKTSVCRVLLNQLTSGTKVAMITNTHLNKNELIHSILEDLEVPFDPGNRVQLLSRMNEFLIEQLSLNFNVILIIDEAQNLKPEVLEELRMLSNLETEREKLLQIILVGQPQLKDMLSSPELEQLRQRICVQHHISSLNRNETLEYIDHRLKVVSADKDRQAKFTQKAIDEIYAHSRGIPRVINIICDSALLIGYATETREMTLPIIKEVQQQFQHPKLLGPEEINTRLDDAKQKLISLAKTQTKELAEKQSQVKKAKSWLNQLNEQLNQARENMNKAQAEQAQVAQLWLERQKEQQKKEEETAKRLQSMQEELRRCEAIELNRRSELKALTEKTALARQNLQDLDKSAKAQSRKLTGELKIGQRKVQETADSLNGLNGHLNQVNGDKQKAQAEHEEVQTRLKLERKELSLRGEAIAKKEVELKQINERLQSNQKVLLDSQSLVDQRKSELNALLSLEETQTKKLAEKQSHLKKAESSLNQLNDQLNQARENMKKAQFEQAQITQLWLERQREQQKKEGEIAKHLHAMQEELRRCEAIELKKRSEIEEFSNKLDNTSKELSEKEDRKNKVISQLKAKEFNLDRLQVNLSQSEEKLKKAQESLIKYESQYNQRESELKTLTEKTALAKEKLKHLEELTKEQFEKMAEDLQSRQVQTEEVKFKLAQLTSQLNKAQVQKAQLQTEQEKAERILLSRQKEWKEREQKSVSRLKVVQQGIRLCESAWTQKQAELEESTKRLKRTREELAQSEVKAKKLEAELKANHLLLEELEHKASKIEKEQNHIRNKTDRFQRELKELTQSWLNHQDEWRRQEKKILGQSLPQSKETPIEEIPFIKLKAKKPDDKATFLTAYTSDGEIKINQLNNQTYSGIRMIPRNRYVGNYKNLNFFAKSQSNGFDQHARFRVELKNIMTGIGKHYEIELNPRWQKVTIPLEDFGRTIDLDIVTEVSVSLDGVKDEVIRIDEATNGIIHINNICFSGKS